jgi:hypothetical protein
MLSLRRVIVGLCVLGCVAGLSAAPAWAVNPCVVAADGDSGSSTLREVINNEEANPGDCPTITFQSGLSTITLTSGPIVISGNITIDGTGSPVITSNASTGVFAVTTATDVTLDDLTIDGLTSATDGGAVSINQGNSSDTVTVENSTFEDDYADGYDGAALADVGPGTLTVSGSTFENDDVGSGDGGAIFNDTGSTLDVTSGTLFEANSATDGAAIYNDHTLNVTGATFEGNAASAGGGAISNVGGASVGDAADLTADDSSFVGNTAATDGGAIDDTDPGGVFAYLTVTGSEFVGNQATTGSGGAINDAATMSAATASVVTGSTFVGDEVSAASDGSAISVTGGQPLQVAANLFAEDCAGTITSVGYNVALPSGNPSPGGSTCVGSTPKLTDSVSTAAGEVIKSTQNSQLMVAEEDNPAIDLIPDNTSVIVDGTVDAQLCPATDLLGNSGPDVSGKCDAGALQSDFQPSTAGGGSGDGGGSGSGGGSGPGGGSGSGAGADGGGSSASPSTTTTVTTTKTTKVKFDNQQITLVSPSLNVCTAPGKNLSATLSSKKIKKSKKPRLTFKLAKFTAGGKDKHTAKRLTAKVSIKLKGLKAKSTDKLKVVVSYKMARKHKKPKVVSKTITVKFKVC